MRLSKKTLGLGAVALGLTFAGWTLYATNAVSCDHGAKSSASATQTSTDVKPVSNPGGCAGAAMGACPHAKNMAGGGACCAGMKATTASATEAGPMFPKGTTVTRTEVEGGVDFVFTGTDLKGIKSALDDHVKACNKNMKKMKGMKGQQCPQCTITANETGVTLSIRGENIEQCCAGMMATSDQGDGTKASACPAMQGKPAKTVVKKS